MNWEKIRKAMYDSALLVDSGMTIKEFEEFTAKVKEKLSHKYNGEGEECTVCNKEYGNEFHIEYSTR